MREGGGLWGGGGGGGGGGGVFEERNSRKGKQKCKENGPPLNNLYCFHNYPQV